MEPGNNTGISEYLLWGFSEDPELKFFIFGFFLSVYLIIISGSLLIILANITDSHLHTTKYFFFSNLFFIDICFTTTMPKMLVNIQTQIRVITYADCLTQIYFFMLFVGLDDSLLAVMAYDHFMAICHPLNYMAIMHPQLCRLLVLGSWTMSALHSLLQTVMVLQLSFHKHLEIPHFFCELDQIIQLSCSDTFFNEIVTYFAAGLLGFGAFTGIIYSYSKIFSSDPGVYLSSIASPNAHFSATASVMYTIVTPMLNPFIYSMRNKEMMRSLKRFFRREVIKVSFFSWANEVPMITGLKA